MKTCTHTSQVRLLRRLFLLAAVGVVCIWSVGCATDAPEVDLPRDVGRTVDSPGLVSRGAHLYMKYCQPCHGATGQGDGPAADVLQTPPRDFTAGKFKFRTTPQSALPTAGDLYRTIAQGVPGTEMPAWDDRLNATEMWSIAAFLETLTPDEPADKPPAPEDLLDIPEPHAASAESIAAGKQLFSQFGCTSCHGEEGRGRGPAAAVLEDYKGRPLAPADFTEGVYKSGPHPGDLYRSIATGLAGTPMPGYGRSLQPDQIWNLVHYIRSLREDRGVLDYLLNTDPGRL